MSRFFPATPHENCGPKALNSHVARYDGAAVGDVSGYFLPNVVDRNGRISTVEIFIAFLQGGHNSLKVTQPSTNTVAYGK